MGAVQAHDREPRAGVLQVVADESATALADVEEQRFAFGHDLGPVLPSRPVDIDGDEPLSWGRGVIGEEIELAAEVCDHACLGRRSRL